MQEIYLSHHGILGQKWGVRRYQNEDGTLTNAGKKRYYKTFNKAEQKYNKNVYNDFKKHRYKTSNVDALKRDIKEKEIDNSKEWKDLQRKAMKNAENGIWDLPLEETNRVIDKQRSVYEKHSDELLSARLKDLKLPDTNETRQVYKQYKKDKISKLGVHPDDYLMYF